MNGVFGVTLAIGGGGGHRGFGITLAIGIGGGGGGKTFFFV
jgi:hypothetical protein